MRSPGSPRSRRLPRRAAAVAVAAVLGTAGLAGCGAGNARPAAASSSAPSSSASSTTAAADLARGLLPASAFGSDAAVTSVTLQQLQQGTATGAGGLPSGATITPEQCAAALRQTQPQSQELHGAAAEIARQGTTTTVEVLGGSDRARELVSLIPTAIAACPQVQVSAPQLGSATITLAPLDVPKLGDGSAGISITTVVTRPDGQQVSVPALVGLAADGNRLVALVTASTPGVPGAAPQGAAPDPQAFGALLRQAFQAQADKLD